MTVLWPYPAPPYPPPRYTWRGDRALTWSARCPHGRVGEWLAKPTEMFERIETTCACPCPEEAA